MTLLPQQLGQPPTLSHLLYTDYGPGFDKVGRPLVDRYGHLREESTSQHSIKKAEPTATSQSSQLVSSGLLCVPKKSNLIS